MSGQAGPNLQAGLQFDPRLSFGGLPNDMGGQGLQLGGNHGLGLKADLMSPVFDGTNAKDAITLGQVQGGKPMMGNWLTDDQKKMMMLAGLSMMGAGGGQEQMPPPAPAPFSPQATPLLGVIPGSQKQQQPIQSALLGRYIK